MYPGVKGARPNGLSQSKWICAESDYLKVDEGSRQAVFTISIEQLKPAIQRGWQFFGQKKTTLGGLYDV
jgi:hypothetical protein